MSKSHIVKILYTAQTRTRGAREQGVSRSPDGLLDIRFATPGSARIGTTPEQLLAAAWSASLESAIAVAARQRTIVFPVGRAIEAEVDLCLADGAYFLQSNTRQRKRCNQSGLSRTQRLPERAKQPPRPRMNVGFLEPAPVKAKRPSKSRAPGN